jgi:hypothetical protein
LTSYLRISIAIIIYLAILALELLEGWWVLSLDWHVFSALYHNPAPREEGGWNTVVSYVLAEGLWLGFSALTIIVGAMILMVQVICIAELVMAVIRGPQKKANAAER